MTLDKDIEMETPEALRRALEDLDTNPYYVAEHLKLAIADEVIICLRQKGWTKSDLARRLGKSRQYVTKMLKGDTNFTLETLAALSIALEKDFHFAFSERGASVRWLQVVRGGKAGPVSGVSWSGSSRRDHYDAAGYTELPEAVKAPGEATVAHAEADVA